MVIHHSHFLSSEGLSFEIAKFLGNGVDLFFVVSGFLITNILLQAKGKADFFKNFYIRRILRIVPLYYLILSLNFFIIPLINLPHLDKLKHAPAWPYWTFLSNFYLAAQGRFENGLIDLSWSLSVEEQFYIFWSLAVFCFSGKQLKRIVLTILCLSPVLRYILLSQFQVNHVAIHVMSFTRMDTIMMGCLLALNYKEDILNHKSMSILLIVGILGLALLHWLPLNLRVAGTYTVVGFIYLALVGITILGNQKILALLELKFIARIGLYSYGIYLFHNPIQKALRIPFQQIIEKSDINPMIFQIIFYLVVILISCIISGVSYHLYESQWLKLKNRFNANAY